MSDLALWNDFVARPDWFDLAACAPPGIDPAVFFPPRNEYGSAGKGLPLDEFSDGEMVAKAICATCDVREECLAYGLHEPFGIWGGRTLRERRHIRRTLARATA